MSNTIGKNYKLTVFGESHGKSIGVIIDGLPTGVNLDIDEINFEMDRRRPGKNKVSTARNEKDQVEIQSGFFDDETTGSALCGIINNNNTKSKDYSELMKKMRPSHSDYPAKIKYNGFNDIRGGGQFSGRLTAPVVFAGAIAKQVLAEQNIFVGSHIKSIKNIVDAEFTTETLKKETLDKLRSKTIPTLNEEKASEMEAEILKFKEQQDSVGGVVEACILNLPVGIGEPLFDSFESNLAHFIFSIPGVKGLEFGAGFDITKMVGSEANDEYYYDEDGNVKTYSNNNGGILGGITNGMPVTLKVAFKPTPSISKEQRTVNLETGENTTMAIHGRHDPCIVQRALVVVESVLAIVTLDMLLERKKNG